MGYHTRHTCYLLAQLALHSLDICYQPLVQAETVQAAGTETVQAAGTEAALAADIVAVQTAGTEAALAVDIVAVPGNY